MIRLLIKTVTQNLSSCCLFQELNYADVSIFQNRNGGRVQLGSQNETSDYAEVKITSSAAGSTPPTYDDHMQRVKRPAPQPGGYSVNVYAQVKKD